jgi:ATP-binding cassette subfamily B protein
VISKTNSVNQPLENQKNQTEEQTKLPLKPTKKTEIDDDSSGEDILGKAYDGKLIQRFGSYLAPYKKKLGFAVVIVLGVTIAELSLPFLTKIAIDNYIKVGDVRGMWVVMLFFFLALIGGFTLRYSQAYLIQGVAQRVMYDLRLALFTKVQTLSLSFFDKTPVGSLMSRMTSDVDALNEVLTNGVVNMLSHVITLIAIIGIMFVLDWRLALVGLAVLPFIIVAAIFFQKAMYTSFRKQRARLSRINGFLNENINGMLVAQLFNREPRAFNEFEKLNRRYYDVSIIVGVIFAVFFPIVNIFMAIGISGLILVGGNGVLDNWVTFGTLVAFLQYLQMTFIPISDLAEKYNILQQAMTACERIFRVLDEEPQIKDAEQVKQFQLPFRGDIEFRNVHFNYVPDEPVLRNVSFHIPAGTSVALVGATGAGKTSIISLLTRFYDVQKGEIIIDGMNVKEVAQADLRSHIGIVLQDPVIFSGTIASNIRLLNKNITDEQVRAAAEFVNAAKFIEKLEGGYNYEVKERGANLSVGQRQLLAFARAIAFNPEVLLVLDEATSSVDSENEALIQEALEKLMEGRTSIIIAHRLSTIRHVDRIIVMHKGQVVENGTHNELLEKRGFYYRLYSLQYQDQEVH